MGHDQSFFAVPANVSLDEALARFGEMAQELRRENGYRGVYLATHDEEHVRASGMRAFYFVVDPWRDGWRVGPNFFIDRWSGSALFWVVYDDHRPRYVWEHVPVRGRRQTIEQEGHELRTRNIELTVDHPQRSLTPAQLDALFAKEWNGEPMTDAERAVVAGYRNAIDVGIAQFGFVGCAKDFVELFYATTAWSLLDEPCVRRPLPDTAGPVVDTVP